MKSLNNNLVQIKFLKASFFSKLKFANYATIRSTLKQFQYAVKSQQTKFAKLKLSQTTILYSLYSIYSYTGLKNRQIKTQPNF